jgi:clan AA aspartic protease (TIGR02281 family)
MAGENATFRVGITVNGRVKTTALVDTGATAVVLCRDMAKSLGLKLDRPAHVATMNGLASAEWTSLTTMEIEKAIIIQSVRAMVMDGQDCGEIVLGMSALRKLHLVITGETLVLSGPASPPSSGRHLARRGRSAPR